MMMMYSFCDMRDTDKIECTVRIQAWIWRVWSSSKTEVSP